MCFLSNSIRVILCLSSLLLPSGFLKAQSADLARNLASITEPGVNPTWWQHAVLYEIYPRSFGDSNADGIGDQRDHGASRVPAEPWRRCDLDCTDVSFPTGRLRLRHLGLQKRRSQYGTLADFDRLQSQAKKHNIRILLDMVLNHTSDHDKWFLESASSRSNPKADWYVWNDGIPANTPGVSAYQMRFAQDNGKAKVVPPNNWVSLFGGSAWEWVPARKQYYYHDFYKQQPDLNWRNPAVEHAMFGVMQFWLDRGVAGFRLDAVPALFEDPQLRSEPEMGGLNAQGDPNLKKIYTDNLPEVHGVIRRMRAMVAKYPGDRVLIGETYLPNTIELDKWYGGAAHDELQLPMDMLVGFGHNEKLSAAYFRQYITEVETQVHGSQLLLVFDNHDNVRSINRFGDGTHDVEIAKIIATCFIPAGPPR